MSRAPLQASARAALLAATLALAPLAAHAHDGAKLYAQRCLNCHSVPAMAGIVQRLGPDAAVRERLEALLPFHHAPDHQDHAAIIDYVLTLRPRS